MSAQISVFLYGHSFPARLMRQAQEQGKNAKSLLGLNDHFNIFVEGHPGLTYRRILGNLPHYFSELKSKSFDILLIDLGTNDLCNPDDPPEILLQHVVQFIDQLRAHDISPQKVVFLSVIKRFSISRRGQVSLTTFNHRVKKFNNLLASKLKDYPDMGLYNQRRLNHPRFLRDGCHPNPGGMQRYFRGVKEAIYRCKL